METQAVQPAKPKTLTPYPFADRDNSAPDKQEECERNSSRQVDKQREKAGLKRKRQDKMVF